MCELTKLSITEAIHLMQNKKLSPVELVQAHIARSEEVKELNAYITTTYDIALEAAQRAEAKYMKGEAEAIEGIPIAIKDTFCTQNTKTTAGSRMLHNFVPDYESTVTEKLFASGGIMIGKTNMDEFAMGSTNLSSYFGPVINPWQGNTNSKLVPGGSSGGSAAAVAAYSAMGALGSDTGGSVRQPASFTGIVGVKPTYGRCSRYGMIAFASSLDQAGVLTRSVSDAALLLQSICGHDPKDATSSNQPIPNWLQSINEGVKGLKIGVPEEYKAEGLPEEVYNLWQIGIQCLKEAGAEIVNISLPHTHYGLTTYYTLAPAEAASNLARYDGVRYGLRIEEEGDDIYAMIAKTRGAGFGAEVKRRIIVGTYLLSSSQYEARYLRAQKIRTLVKQDFTKAFEKIDAILTPTAPSEAFAIDEEITDPSTLYLKDLFTVNASLAGLPAISVPAGFGKSNLPLGLQVIGNYFDEEAVFKVAQQIELARGLTNL